MLKKNFIFKKFTSFIFCALVSFTSVFSCQSISSYANPLSDLWNKTNDFIYNLSPYSWAINKLNLFTDKAVNALPDSIDLTIHPVNNSVLNINDNSIFNPVTNTYETINNVDNSSTDNSIHVTTNNYDYSVTNNVTYFSYVITSNLDPSNVIYRNVYYELPDGRSSFNLTPDDIRGVIFNYNVVNYQQSPLSDLTSGIWHLDGSFKNELYPDSDTYKYYSNSWVDGYWQGGARLSPYSPEDIFVLYNTKNLENELWTVEMKVYFPKVGWNNILTDGYDRKYYSFNPFGFLENYGFKPEPDTWNDISICHLRNGRFLLHLNGEYVAEFADGANKIFGQNYLNNLIAYSGNELRFRSAITDQFVVLGENDYAFEVLGSGFIFDEVRLTFGNLYDVQGYYPLSYPYDLSFAYTVPVSNDYELVLSDKTNLNLGTSSGDFYFYPLSFGSSFSANYKNYYNFNLKFNAIGTDGNSKVERLYFLQGDAPFTSNEYIPNFSSSYLRTRLRCHYYINSDSRIVYEIYNQNDSLIASASSFSNRFSFVESLEVDTSFVNLYDKVYSSLPDTIAIKSNIPVARWQIGGVRSVTPGTGDVFMSFDDGKVLSVQQYYRGSWNAVDAGIFYQGRWYDVKLFDFYRMMILPDSNINSPNSGSNVIINNYNDDDTETNSLLTRIAAILSDGFGVPDGSNPVGDGSSSKFDPNDIEWRDILLPLIYVCFIFMLLIVFIIIILLFTQYIIGLITIAATSLGLPDSFTSAFDWLRGNVEDPFYLISVGDFHLSCFDFMVLIFEIAFLGSVIMIIRKLSDNLHIPTFKE